MECSQLRDGSGHGGQHEPIAPAYPEVADRAPEKVDCVRQRDECDDAGATRGIDTFASQQIRESAANESNGHDCYGRNEEIEQPGSFVWLCARRGWKVAFGVLSRCRLHVG